MRSLLLWAMAVMIAGVWVSDIVAMEIPKASGKALGVAKGRPFTAGIVFVNGRYLEPPYVVERWGNGIRINGVPVISQVVEWTEFLKTQAGLKVEKKETQPAPPPPEPEAEPEEEDEELEDDINLDDLFEDNPKPKKAAPKKAAKKKSTKPKVQKPVTTVSYSLEGDFVPNDASKALLERVNKTRTDINTVLLNGGFFFFGDAYSRVSGDARTTEILLEKIPDLQRKCSGANGADQFIAGIRASNLSFLTESICAELYRNRVDYLKLLKRREKLRDEKLMKKLLNGEKARF